MNENQFERMSNADLTSRSIVELAALIRGGEVSPTDVLTAHLERINSLNPKINAIVTLAPDVLEQAKRLEAVLADKEVMGALHGVPLTIKDTIETEGIRTTSGSRVRENHIPAADATAVRRLKAAGAIVLGKTNTPEMAIPYETDNPVFGRTNNPYDQSLTAGGSSGGEAAAIAATMSPGGVGSDLSGSIRVPAHFCGIVGLKPTSGRIPMDGHVPVAKGVLAKGACIGPMARTVADVALLFNVLAGIDQAELPSAEALKGSRVCWYDFDGVSPVSAETKQAVRTAVRALVDGGLNCEEKRPPGIQFGASLWVDLFAAAAANDLQEFYSGSENLAGPLARKILERSDRKQRGTSRELERALKQRNQLRSELLTILEATPLMLSPVGSTAAFPHNSSRVDVNGESISVFRAFSYAQTFNVFDLPGAVVRAGTAGRLPVGVQIVGRPFAEQTILAAAKIIEEALGTWPEIQR